MLAVGDYDGRLRLFLPRQRGAMPEDLLLELATDQPILQLAAACLAGNDRSVQHLAVLQPRQYTVYALSGPHVLPEFQTDPQPRSDNHLFPFFLPSFSLLLQKFMQKE